jgi:diguanylate cyclase (GGDEF)-like protein
MDLFAWDDPQTIHPFDEQLERTQLETASSEVKIANELAYRSGVFVGRLLMSEIENQKLRQDNEDLERDNLALWEEMDRQHELNIRLGREHLALTEAHDLDPLTGIKNRRGLEKAFDSIQKSRQAQRSSEIILTEPMRKDDVIAFIDLDGFKQVNDTLGHNLGDDLLKKVAAQLMECIRNMDTPGKLGGDEFVIILRQVGMKKAIEILSEIGEEIEKFGKDFGGTTASIGITPIEADDNFDLALHKADIAMYRSKLAGKNQLTIYDSTFENTEIPKS